MKIELTVSEFLTLVEAAVRGLESTEDAAEVADVVDSGLQQALRQVGLTGGGTGPDDDDTDDGDGGGEEDPEVTAWLADVSDKATRAGYGRQLAAIVADLNETLGGPAVSGSLETVQLNVRAAVGARYGPEGADVFDRLA